MKKASLIVISLISIYCSAQTRFVDSLRDMLRTEQNQVVKFDLINQILENEVNTGANIDAAKAVGKLLAERAVKNGVTEVVFDRGGYLYHGRVKALADAARESGLSF